MSYSCVILVFAGVLMLVRAAPSVYMQDSEPTTIKDNFYRLADAISKICKIRNIHNEPCEASITPEEERFYNNIADVSIIFLDGLFGRKPAASIQNIQLLSRPYLQNAALTPPPPDLGSPIRALADFIQTLRALIKRPGGKLNLLLNREVTGLQHYRK